MQDTFPVCHAHLVRPSLYPRSITLILPMLLLPHYCLQWSKTPLRKYRMTDFQRGRRSLLGTPLPLTIPLTLATLTSIHKPLHAFLALSRKWCYHRERTASRWGRPSWANSKSCSPAPSVSAPSEQNASGNKCEDRGRHWRSHQCSTQLRKSWARPRSPSRSSGSRWWAGADSRYGKPTHRRCCIRGLPVFWPVVCYRCLSCARLKTAVGSVLLLERWPFLVVPRWAQRKAPDLSASPVPTRSRPSWAWCSASHFRRR